ncbi:type IV toxin-antitoxin system AbiEi family antitoxin domain-containing protein [Promicromonospora aerolata]|uniref:Type IV toxin-antitoxin system AbiEi family antitoxin domain-containing protein n=1 Tax=Promicromonospora aerolata TaxID=195749 RepID=A0ABW4VGW5_9MICO
MDVIDIHPQLLQLARRQAGLVSSGQCDAHGVTNGRRRRLVATGRWQRVTRGVFDTGCSEPGLHPYDRSRLRSAWLALLAYPGSAAVGACALALLGVAGLPSAITPEAAFANGSGRESRDGILLRQYRAFPRVAVGDHFAAEPAHALAQALPQLDREHGVAVMDSLQNKRILTPSGMRTAQRLAENRRYRTTSRPWWGQHDGRSQSPVETVARLRLMDAGIGPDDLQRDLFDATGQFLGRADLAWHLGTGRWLLVEVDSDEFHSSPEQVRRDAVRQNRLLRDGRHVLLRFFARQVHEGTMVGTVRSVLDREGWVPARPIPPPVRRR